ncbi:DNA gyrase C-terminal beta-propeller domain-containing protein [Escherichia coli]
MGGGACTHQGYVKYQPLSEYEAQRQVAGEGKSAARISKKEDFIDRLLVATYHDHILCFSSRGNVYSMKIYALPEAAGRAR